MSSRSPSATCARTSPVAGLYVGKVLPEAEFTNWLLINICRGLRINSSTRLCIGAVLVAVAIAIRRGGARIERHFAGTEIVFFVRSKDRAAIVAETIRPHPAQEFIRDSAVLRCEAAPLT